ncbi:sugar O-acetyltransferase [Longibaculum muris]|uniref:sugar O-acetyltransferase n=1 Tax=Longibaculum muris TaxID=1796628 RepID=UPI0022DEF41E|nr:sugar O-acetyltransferase [Longibaculum muris]
MSLEENMKNGKMFREYGHSDPKDIAYAKKLETLRITCKDKVFEYNHTIPSSQDTKKAILKDLLGDCGEHIWIEAPMFFAYGCHTHIGDYFYANCHLTIIDDVDVYIGDHVMFGPNVTIAVTGHPLDKDYRLKAAHYSETVTIGNNVWIGANAVILPGVSIGDNSVIGAGSIVTHDIPASHLAYGNPCRVIREINEYDKVYFRKGKKVNEDW